MKKTEIVLQYVTVEGKQKEGIIKRNEFLEIMEYFKNTYPSNNEVSSKLVPVIPEIDTILINKRVARDTPFIVYVIDSKLYWLDINANHRKIWSCLDDYCKKTS